MTVFTLKGGKMAWYIVIPISNIQLNVSNYNMGNITLHQANNYNISQNCNSYEELAVCFCLPRIWKTKNTK